MAVPCNSSYTPEKHRVIVRALKDGVSRRAAAGYAGVTDATLRNWVKRGLNGEEPFDKFAADVAHAEASIEEDMTKSIVEAARAGDWRAGESYLEKRVPEWRPKKSVNVEGELERILDAVEQECGAEAAERVFARLTQSTGEETA